MNPEKLPATLAHWQQHPFYTSQVVVACDIGLKGIGIAVRQGPKILFRQTFEFALPVKSSVLGPRRQKRAGRRARLSRDHRDAAFRQWCLDFGLLTKEQVAIFWRNDEPDENWKGESSRHAQRVYEHRLRAITGGVASPLALAVCLRHLVRHRGFDYHMTEESAWPWGDELKFGDIADWLRKTAIPESYAEKLREMLLEPAEPLFKEALREKLKAELAAAVTRYEKQPVRKMLVDHLRQKEHPNLREPARGYNFPRELIKEHAWEVLHHPRHAGFIAQDRMAAAVRKLLGEFTETGGTRQWRLTEDCIMDYHRKTREKAERHWERKTGNCPYSEPLHAEGLVGEKQAKRGARREWDIRRFMLLQYLAERKFELDTGLRPHASPGLIQWLLAQLDADVQALKEKQPRPKFGKLMLKKEYGQRLGVRLSGNTKSLNPDYFEQLNDLLSPPLSELDKRASMSAAAARALFEMGTAKGTDFTPSAVRDRLTPYYQWRRNNDSSWGLYPQVEFLMGNRGQYDDAGLSQDRRDSAECREAKCARADGVPQEHGIIRRLFAGQICDAHGKVIDLRPFLSRADGKPDCVIIEVAGELPRSEEQRQDIKKAQKASREHKEKIVESFGISEAASDGLKRKALLLDQQRDEDGQVRCPYTGIELPSAVSGTDGSQTDHMFPAERGGLTVQDNLCVTRGDINAAKGNHTPHEVAGTTRNGITFLSWAEMKRCVATFRWGAKKQAIFTHEGTEPPDFENVTRLAQLARQLRSEMVRWLGIRQRHTTGTNDQQEAAIAMETWQRIGCPAGGHTHACAETWLPHQQFPDYWRPVMRHGREDWIKSRDSQRHHLWDAILLSFIPPGNGLNNTDCRGIFRVSVDEQSGSPVLRPLVELGPPVNLFPAVSDAETCLVQRPRQDKSKQKRTKETIQSPPDGTGKRKAREELAKYVKKKDYKEEDMRKLLRAGGISERLLSDKDISDWWQQRTPDRMTQHELRDFLSGNGVDTSLITQEKLDAWWLYKDKMQPEKKITVTALLKLFKDCGFPPNTHKEETVQSWLENHIKVGTLRLPSFKDGTPGQPVYAVRVEQDAAAETSYVAHRNAEGEIIGYKVSGEAFYCHKLFRESRPRPGGGTEDTYWRMKLPHPRNQRNWEKQRGLQKGSWCPPLGEIPPKSATLLGTLRKGQLLRLPINKDSKFAKRGEPATLGWHWYRVTALKSSKGNAGAEVEMKMAEYIEIKKPKKDEDFAALSAATQRLIKIYEQRPKSDEDLAYILELNDPKRPEKERWQVMPAPEKPKKTGRAKRMKGTTSHDPSPDSAGGKPGPACDSGQTYLRFAEDSP